MGVCGRAHARMCCGVLCCECECVRAYVCTCRVVVHRAVVWVCMWAMHVCMQACACWCVCTHARVLFTFFCVRVNTVDIGHIPLRLKSILGGSGSFLALALSRICVRCLTKIEKGKKKRDREVSTETCKIRGYQLLQIYIYIYLYI